MINKPLVGVHMVTSSAIIVVLVKNCSYSVRLNDHIQQHHFCIPEVETSKDQRVVQQQTVLCIASSPQKKVIQSTTVSLY